jgi:hypothetical protein
VIYDLLAGKQPRGPTLFTTQCDFAEPPRIAPSTLSSSPRRRSCRLAGECKAHNRLPPTPAPRTRSSTTRPRKDRYQCPPLYSDHHRPRYTFQTTSPNPATPNGRIKTIPIPTPSASTNARYKSIYVPPCSTKFNRTTSSTYDGRISGSSWWRDGTEYDVASSSEWAG